MIRHVRTKKLSIAYQEYGPADGQPVILAHGFPDDALTWRAVTAQLVDKGYRVLLPWQRGFGETRFLRWWDRRAGQYSVLAQDLIDFADALRVDRFVLAGHDWGAAAGYIAACLWPERVAGLVTMSVGYEGGQEQDLSHAQMHAYWYQWLFNFHKGEKVLREQRTHFCRYLWQVWAPDWHFTEGELEATAVSWTNRDFVKVVIHSYRHRWKTVKGTLHGDALMKRVRANPKIAVPTILLHGEIDGASLAPSSAGKEKFFTGSYERRVLRGVGHFIPRTAPDAAAQAIMDVTPAR